MRLAIIPRYIIRLLFLAILSTGPADAVGSDNGYLSDVQARLYSGRSAEANKSAKAWAAAQSGNQTARFAVASVHFFQAVEGLGQGFYKYGLRSVWKDPSGGMSGLPFLRLPVPENLNPERAAYADITRVLGGFYDQLQSVDAELSQIKLNDAIDYPLDIKQVRLNSGLATRGTTSRVCSMIFAKKVTVAASRTDLQEIRT